MAEPLKEPQFVADEPKLPPDLAAALRHLYAPPITVPAATDEAILRDAGAGLARRLRFRTLVRAAGAVGGIAAAVLLFVFVKHHHWDPKSQPSIVATGSEVRPGDADRSGRVDMLDAFVLARKIDSRTATPAPAKGWEDVNTDGVLDKRDVDQVATLAVSLTPINRLQ
jgi:hypothetical protein